MTSRCYHQCLDLEFAYSVQSSTVVDQLLDQVRMFVPSCVPRMQISLHVLLLMLVDAMSMDVWLRGCCLLMDA